MTNGELEQAIKEYLIENLNVSVHCECDSTNHFEVQVSLNLGDETISVGSDFTHV